MTQNEREQIQRVIGMLSALEYIVDNPSGAGEAITEANDILKDLVKGEMKCKTTSA